jgi:hypothetical protein
MVTDDSLNRFIHLLADWVAAAPGDRQPTRALLDPRNDDFRLWLRAVAGTQYWDKFDRRGGLSKEEFEEECLYRLFLWMQHHKEQVAKAELTINNLEAFVRTIAQNYCRSLGRRLRRRWFHSLDEYSEEPDDDTPRRTPEKLQVSADDPTAARYPSLEGEFLHAQRLIPEFVRSLVGREKTLELLRALRALGVTLGKLHGFPADWWVFRVLKRPRKEHLPLMVQKFLRVKFAMLEPSTLAGRVTYLRRIFRTFLSRWNNFDSSGESKL